MSLIKKEIICLDCDKHYILVIKPEDQHEVLSCVFCDSPISSEDEEKEEEFE